MKFVRIALTSLFLISPVTFADDGKPQVTLTTPNPDHTCATNFLAIYEQRLEFKGRAIAVGIGNLSGIETLLGDSGLPGTQAALYADGIKAIAFGATDAVDVLGQVLPFVRNVWEDEGLFGVSVPSRASVTGVQPFMSHHPVNAPFKYVGKFATAPGYAEIPKRPEYPQYDEKTFWNGVIFYPLAFDQAPDQATAYITTISKFFNKVSQLQAEFMLGQLSRYIQSSGKPHPKLAGFVSADGKEIDYGFARVFAETRGVVAEIQAAQYAMALISVPDNEITRWVEYHRPLIIKLALERLKAAPVLAQPILDKLKVTESSFLTDWKKFTEWVLQRGR